MEFNIIMFSILFILGLLVGLTIMVIINSLKETKASKKAEAILEKAQKDAEKIKRDNILEAKEESHKLKIET